MSRNHPLLILSLLTPPLWAPSPAFPALGGDAASVQADQQSLRAVRRATVSNGYTVHELTTDNGTAVREYANAQGKVFAVVWQGPFMPDLVNLLGAYFPTFKVAADARRAGGLRGPLSVEQDDLVVQSGGRLRAYSGRAYVPSLLPAHISIVEIQ